MKKPKPKTRKIYDYHEMVHYVEKKYGFDCRRIHDFMYEESRYVFNQKHRTAWEEKNYPRMIELRKDAPKGYYYNAEALKFFETPEGEAFHNEVEKAYRDDPEGEAKEIPYMDFWHFILDYLDGNVMNPSLHTINWTDIREYASEDWQIKICDFFVAEYGDEELEVEIQW